VSPLWITFRPTPGKFYKGRSQEKTPRQRLAVFLLRSPLDGAGSVLTTRTRCSVAGQCGPAVGVFSTSGFHRFFATKPISSETSKAERRSSGDHSSIRDSWPIAFSGYPRGPRVGCETWCPKHAASNLPAETRSRTRVSRDPTATAEKYPEMERTRSETLKLFVVSDIGRRSAPLSSIRSTQWWQSSSPRSDVPSPVSSLWQARPRRIPGTDLV
jgi:hypothetical protein